MTPEEKRLSGEICERIRTRARKRGMSIERLADFAGVSHGTLWTILRGAYLPSLGTLLRLSTALDCRIRDLLPP